MATETVINSKQLLEEYIRHLRNQFDDHKYLRIKISTGKQRTLTQNKAMHVYFGLLIHVLVQAGGLIMRKMPFCFGTLAQHQKTTP